MHTLIISGGTIDTDFALDLLKKEKYDHIIGVDGALKFCKEQNIVPTRIVGDFDTLDPEILTWYQTNTQIEIRQFNPVKDATAPQMNGRKNRRLTPKIAGSVIPIKQDMADGTAMDLIF